jgi:CRP-like cAMP-binding protein
MSADIIRFLKGVPFLSGLPEQALVRLGAQERRFAAQEVVVREGDAAGDLYIIREGSVDIVKGHGRPDRQVIAARGPGELIGEMGLFGEQRRYATVVAREPTTIVAIPYQTFRAVVEESPAAFGVIRALVEKLRQAQDARIRAMRHEVDEARQSAAGTLTVVVAFLYRLQSSVEGAVGAADAIGLGGKLLDAVDSELRRRFTTLQNAVAHVQRETAAVTGFVSLVGSQGRLVRQQMNLADMAERAVGDLRMPAAAVGVEIALETATGLQEISGDAAKLVEAMYWLLYEVVASEASSTVVVRVFQRENAVYFEVRDPGGKIPIDYFAHAWDWARSAEALAQGEAINLNVMILAYTVKAHGGNVWARRETDSSVSLGFWLPTGMAWEDDADWL